MVWALGFSLRKELLKNPTPSSITILVVLLFRGQPRSRLRQPEPWANPAAYVGHRPNVKKINPLVLRAPQPSASIRISLTLLSWTAGGQPNEEKEAMGYRLRKRG